MTIQTAFRSLLASFALACLSAAAIAQPPPLPTGGSATYFIDEGGQPAGPLSIDQLRQRIATGSLTSATLAWTDGMASWQPAAQVPGLGDLFQQSAARPVATSAAGTQPAQFLIGRWQVKGKLPLGEQGPTDGEMLMTYNADGSFSMEGQYQLPHPEAGIVPISVNMSGRWSVNGQVAQDRIPVFLDGQMTMTVPAQFNMPPQSESMAQDETLRIIDANTLIDNSQLTWRRL